MRRLTDKPLRLMVEDVYTNKRVIIGKILSGNLKVG